MIRIGQKLAIAAVFMLSASGATAQTNVPGDPHASDPVGIVAAPCSAPVTPDQGGGWQMWNLHMLTRDFGQLCRYAADDRALLAAHAKIRVVFMGDSITDNWRGGDPGMWTDGRIDRGISGQTTPQMLVRFRQDVIELHPQAVHIMAGTNDIAGNTGAATMATVEGNIATMAELARAHGIKVMLASIPPAAAFPWSPDKHPVPQIAELNVWLKHYATTNGFTCVDYHAALAGPDGGMKPGLASDGVHPTPKGYSVMRPITMAAIARTLGK